ncbi:MAG: 2-dehydropantoate 2-reductase [Promethearchaeota archaeon]|nr:MAG: 2-dehydropantoate 2-reductase [Candidatus Lokiarchaeota archaeon]
MAQKQIRIGIIGAGSIGSLFGGYLANIKSDTYQIEVIFFGRKTHIEEINENGLILIKDEKISTITGIKGYVNPKNYLKEDGKKRIDFCFLTTKSYDIGVALEEYKNLTDKIEWLIILQNGIGNEELVSEYLPKSKIIRAITSNGAFLSKAGRVEHTGEGFTKIGFAFQKKNEKNEKKEKDLKILKELLTKSGIKTTISNDIIKDCWEKVFVNIGINPFGALTRLRNGKLIEDKKIKELMAEAVKEAVEVALKKGISLPDKDYRELMFEVARKTKDNVNSMLQDILKGKQTEIDFINGKIVQYAEKMEVSVPINKSLTYLVKGLERSTF